MLKYIPYRITGITGVESSEHAHESILILFFLLFVNIFDEFKHKDSVIFLKKVYFLLKSLKF